MITLVTSLMQLNFPVLVFVVVHTKAKVPSENNFAKLQNSKFFGLVWLKFNVYQAKFSNLHYFDNEFLDVSWPSNLKHLEKGDSYCQAKELTFYTKKSHNHKYHFWDSGLFGNWRRHNIYRNIDSQPFFPPGARQNISNIPSTTADLMLIQFLSQFWPTIWIMH